MFNKKYLNEYRNTIYQNNVLKLTLSSLILVIFIEGFFIIKALNTQRTIVIPSVKGKYVVLDKSANTEYLTRMAYFLTNLVENFTPQTIKANYDRFLDYVAPEVYGSMQTTLLTNSQNYIATNTSSYFIPKTIKIFKNRIEITGNRKFIIGDKVVSANTIKITIGYAIKHGLFEVMSYEEEKVH